MLLRKNIVEDILHKISGFEPQYQKGTPTIGISIEDYLRDGSDKYRFDLMEESQINIIAKEIIYLKM
jgi:hypothetical protein